MGTPFLIPGSNGTEYRIDFHRSVRVMAPWMSTVTACWSDSDPSSVSSQRDDKLVDRLRRDPSVIACLGPPPCMAYQKPWLRVVWGVLEVDGSPECDHF